MRLLLVEDSQRLSRSLSEGLEKEGYAVDVALDGLEAEAALLANRGRYELVVLDLMLPKLDGLGVLRHMRDRGDDSHVLILSARDQVEDRVRGLDLGADDYLIKPFEFSELCARLQALTRRRHSQKSPVLKVHGLEIDRAARTVRLEGRELSLTAAEYRLLDFLATRAGRVFSKEHLIEALYPANTFVTANSIEVLVSGLRKRLGSASNVITTRRGHGYTIEAESA